jgi:hypothetical protein
MKKIFFLIFITIKFSFGFAKTNNTQIEETIYKIEYQLAKDYVRDKGSDFSKNITNHNDLISFLTRLYGDNNEIIASCNNLNASAELYKNNEDKKKFLLKAVKEISLKNYNIEAVNSIINNADNNTTGKGQQGETRPITSESSNGVTSTGNINNNELDELQKENQELQKENESLIKENEKLRNQTLNGKSSFFNLKYFNLKRIIFLLLFFSFLFLIKDYLITLIKDRLWKNKNNKIVIDNKNSSSMDKNKSITSNNKNLVAKVSNTVESIQTVTIKNKDINLVVTNIDNSNLDLLTGKWRILEAKSIGKSHISTNDPCQDNKYHLKLSDNWGIAITSDGAGSAKLSHEGSKFITEKTPIYLKKILETEDWFNKNQLPKDERWEEICLKVFTDIKKALEIYAQNNGYEFRDLACTVILVVYSNKGLLVSHIGDGRAGYCNTAGEWKSAIIPHKGEEANQTIFITSVWENIVLSNVNVPESRVIREPIKAFLLMSDGCEQHFYICKSQDPTRTDTYFIEINKPDKAFLDSVIGAYGRMIDDGKTEDEINAHLERYLERGTKELEDEPDDKSIILGFIKTIN